MGCSAGTTHLHLTPPPDSTDSSNPQPNFAARSPMVVEDGLLHSNGSRPDTARSPVSLSVTWMA